MNDVQIYANLEVGVIGYAGLLTVTSSFTHTGFWAPRYDLGFAVQCNDLTPGPFAQLHYPRVG